MCEKCQTLFDIKTNLPYLFPCGHTLCPKCLKNCNHVNNSIKCPIDNLVYTKSIEDIPINEILLQFMKDNLSPPKYTYQIAECSIEEANFSHVDRRNIFQKFFHFLYILIYVKIILTIVNIITWPFRKIYLIFKKIINYIFNIYLKIKYFVLKIINKIKSIHLPKININCKWLYKLKDKFVQSKFIKAIVKFYKYTVRAPLFIKYLKIMSNLLNQSQYKTKNIFIKILHFIVGFLLLLFVHLIAFYTNNLGYFSIILLLLNESVVILSDFMTMNEEKEKKKYIKNQLIIKKSNNSEINAKNKYYKRRKSTNTNYKNYQKDEEAEEEYLKDEMKFLRGKKCIKRWIGFIVFWYFFPIISDFIIKSVIYLNYGEEGNKIVADDDKNKNMLLGIINTLLFIPKLLIIIYLTS